jgi:hypothetical protein
MVTDESTDPIESFTGGKRIAVEPGLAKRLWRQWAETIITVAIIGLYAMIFFMWSVVGAVKSEQANGRERGFKNRAVVCQSLMVDNDRSWALTDDCTEPDVMKYYPPLLCQTMGATQADGCGTEFSPSPFHDPTR